MKKGEKSALCGEYEMSYGQITTHARTGQWSEGVLVVFPGYNVWKKLVERNE